MNNETITLHFLPDGRFHCDGLAPVLRAAGLSPLKPVKIGAGLQPNEIGCPSCPRFTKCGMSHTSTVASEIKDEAAIRAAAEEMGCEVLPHGTHHVYSGDYEGIAVKLPQWNYPVIINTKTGQLKYDNYGGTWGKQEQLEKFQQLYGVHRAMAIAKSQRLVCSRTTLSNGTIRLQATGYLG